MNTFGRIGDSVYLIFITVLSKVVVASKTWILVLLLLKETQNKKDEHKTQFLVNRIDHA